MFRDDDYEPSISVYERERYRKGIYCLNVDGATVWYKNDKIHRDGDEPAIISQSSNIWVKNGKRHRDGDKPAIIESNGFKAWCIDNKYHRDGDKPAIESRDVCIWYKNGKIHRDGTGGESGKRPAVLYSNGNKEYWTNGNKISVDIKKKSITIPMKFI